MTKKIMLLVFLFVFSFQGIEASNINMEKEWSLEVLTDDMYLNNQNSIQRTLPPALTERYKTILISDKPETNWQDVLDGINKFHHAVDVNTLNFDYNKALNIVANDPTLQLVTEQQTGFHIVLDQNITADEVYEQLTNFVLSKLQATISTVEYNTLKQELQGLPFHNTAYYKMIFAIDVNGKIELMPFTIKKQFFLPGTFSGLHYPMFGSYLQGLKAIYTP
ncbi:hypothetical protein [Longirhabdus pacifica]|uniref:hypothetical protein n=1 Tax=Longirhabdus pacifica TaxID=2305227 RepID=UPI001008F893|nr:hypothetical protein [Longirhabdus pacifica]